MAFKVDANATSLASSIVELSSVPNEDLIVLFVVGGGPKAQAVFDDPVPDVGIDETTLEFLEMKPARDIEFLDADTGHSIATRTLEDKRVIFGDREHTVLGNAQINDEFLIRKNTQKEKELSNLEKNQALQTADINEVSSGGFQKVFGTIVAQLGETVKSGEIALLNLRRPAECCRGGRSRVFRLTLMKRPHHC